MWDKFELSFTLFNVWISEVFIIKFSKKPSLQIFQSKSKVTIVRLDRVIDKF